MNKFRNLFMGSACSVLILISSLSLAKTAVRTQSQVNPAPITIKVIYGEKVTLFSILPTNSGAQVDFSNNAGGKGSRKISAADFDYLKNRIGKIPGTPNDRNFCIRNYITISSSRRNMVGCLGAQNVFARDVQSITNLVSVLF